MSANLTYEQRYEIEVLIKRQYDVVDIAESVGVHNSTIYRELRKNSSSNGYKAKAAHKMAKDRAKEAGQAGKKDPEILKAAEDKIKKGWSPEQISGRFNSGGLLD